MVEFVKTYRKPTPRKWDKSRVDTKGYLSPQKRVENILREGMELRQFRAKVSDNDSKASKEIAKDVDGYQTGQPMTDIYMDKTDQVAFAMRMADEFEARLKKINEEGLKAREAALAKEKEDYKASVIAEYEASKAAPPATAS